MKYLNEKKKFAVEAKCGHVGKDSCIIIDFPIIAENGKEAAKIARKIPRVKHDHKDAIISVKKISNEEYDNLIRLNKDDNYLKCTSIQEQRIYCSGIEQRIINDKYFENKSYKEEKKKDKREERISFKRKKYALRFSEDKSYYDEVFI